MKLTSVDDAIVSLKKEIEQKKEAIESWKWRQAEEVADYDKLINTAVKRIEVLEATVAKLKEE